MTIPVQCPGCRKAYKLGEVLAGKQVRCPACAQIIQVPYQAVIIPDVIPAVMPPPLPPPLPAPRAGAQGIQEEARPVKRKRPPPLPETRAAPQKRPVLAPAERPEPPSPWRDVLVNTLIVAGVLVFIGLIVALIAIIHHSSREPDRLAANAPAAVRSLAAQSAPRHGPAERPLV